MKHVASRNRKLKSTLFRFLGSKAEELWIIGRKLALDVQDCGIWNIGTRLSGKSKKGTETNVGGETRWKLDSTG